MFCRVGGSRSGSPRVLVPPADHTDNLCNLINTLERQKFCCFRTRTRDQNLNHRPEVQERAKTREYQDHTENRTVWIRGVCVCVWFPVEDRRSPDLERKVSQGSNFSDDERGIKVNVLMQVTSALRVDPGEE